VKDGPTLAKSKADFEITTKQYMNKTSILSATKEKPVT